MSGHGRPEPRTVVLLPGTLVPTTAYDVVAARLVARGGFDPVPFDWMRDVPQPTLESVADAVAGLIGERGHGPATVVGHSTAGAVAALTALAHPDLVAGLVLVDSGPNMRAHSSIDDMLAGLRAAVTDAQWRGFAWLNIASGTPAQRESWIDSMVRYSRLVGPEPAVSMLESQYAADFLAPGRIAGLPEGRIPAEGLPVELLHGELDAKRKPVDSRAWQAVFPDADFTLVPGCGHTPPLEAPADVERAVMRLQERLHT
ncbi:alpha/beta fold hydrolase [Arthrobacter sp. KK5.5]|uniref:alpha/beta fold hydrolase n=1 Tax=Arthrobacter sp. KK5.5 TaxID=3373084 RepID=UPI003EE5B6F8